MAERPESDRPIAASIPGGRSALRGVAKLGSTPPDPNAKGHAMPANTISFEGVHRFLRTLFAGDLHAKRVLSLAGATMGAGPSGSLKT